MEAEQALPFSIASVVEDVLQQEGKRLSDVSVPSKKADEPALRRYEAAGWLRKTVGAIAARDLPAEPSEEDFRLGLRSGMILCNVINKVQPGAVPKVIESLDDSDGAALSAFQYFENVRNVLIAVEEMGLPTFEASDLEQGGKSARLVNCVLALKSYSDWKQSGGTGSWRVGVNWKPPSSGSGKNFLRKNSETFSSSMTRSASLGDKSVEPVSNSMVRSSSLREQSLSNDVGQDLSEGGASRSISTLVRAVLLDKKPEEIPIIVESMLSKVTKEFERRIASQNELLKASSRDMPLLNSTNELSRTASSGDKHESSSKDMPELDSSDELSRTDSYNEKHKESSRDIPELDSSNELSRTLSCDEKEKEEAPIQVEEDDFQIQNSSHDDELNMSLLKQHILVDKQKKDIQELKQSLHSTKAGIKFLQMKYHEEFNSLGKHLHGLAHAASGYRRVLEENRKLYNQVQDLKGNIRVYCRVRPFLGGQPNYLSTVDRVEEGSISIITPSKYGKEGRKLFNFNRAFGPTATQAEVFSDTQSLIRSVLDGYNVCIFAYGQTGSGKTFTMTGPKQLTEEGLGVNYRALGDLFQISKDRKDTISYEIHVQMLEIYNETVRDLLTTDGQNKRLEIRNSTQNGINVPEANLVPVKSTSDVIKLMDLGHGNRAVSSTAMNDRSSRSHSCLTVHVQGKDLTSGNVIRGSMHLVDLAGSERVDKSEVTGDRLKEAQHINKSLSALGDVISSLASKSQHVPYRNSKLTQLLQDSLGGQAKTLMFVHISPEPEALGETLSTLKFAERVNTIELGVAKANKDNTDVKDLKEQIASLKAALAAKEQEPEPIQLTVSRSADKSRRKSIGFPPSLSKSSSATDFPSNPRQQIEDSSKLKVKGNSAMPRRHSLDLQELRSSPPWPPVSSPSQEGKDDDSESAFADWDDKVMVNKLDSLTDEIPVGHWEVEENALSKSTASNKENPDFEVQRMRYDVASTDESDEAGTSDCSEPDMMWQLNLQLNVPRVSSIPSSLPSKSKKTPVRTTKPAETRSFIPSLIPPPTRRLSSPQLQKPGRTSLGVEGKRRIGNPK